MSNVLYFFVLKFDTEIFFCYNPYVNSIFISQICAMIREHFTTTKTSWLGNTKEYIVLHHTATGEWSLAGVLRTFQHGAVSAHYVIDTDGAIYQFNSDDDILWHAGLSSWEGKTSLNKYSIGIELVGPLPGFTDAQRKSLRKLVLALMQKYAIWAKNIIRHKDISPGRKVDPDDSLWNIAFPSFASYQESYNVIQATVWFYEQTYRKEFGQEITDNDAVIKDIDAVVDRLTRADGSINVKELVYFVAIGLQRATKDRSIDPVMWKYLV